MSVPPVGSIVTCRGREWIVVPSADPDLALLRPLTGTERELSGIYLPLTRLGLDRVEPAQFPLPSPDDASDAVGTALLWNAARLTLRDGAAPLRSLGRVSVRPRAYQFVPLLMALRLDPVRLLIADDVGVGKTIEAVLIARELIDRGEVARLCVLCPPYLCDQWQQELRDKFHLDAAVVRSGTVSQLERDLPAGDHSIFGYYRHLVVSIDYAKAERRRANFVQNCAELVIVDEAHGAARPTGQARGQQQRHELLVDLAKSSRHLILLSATPHSGVEESFRSLLGLLDERFADLDLQNLGEAQRDELARHFVQRRRPDVQRWLGEDTPFPDRLPSDETYELSPRYRDLFERVYAFGRELVRSGEGMSGWRQRIRYWSALALLRCVMSSPAAAEAALRARTGAKAGAPADEEGDEAYVPYVFEPTDDDILDAPPVHIVEEVESEIEDAEKRRLREFARLAAELRGGDQDRKIARCAEIVGELLGDGFAPIVWCRYIATSDYVAEELQRRLQGRFRGLRVVSITGALADDERRTLVGELGRHSPRVLVATDCLSEGINLQEWFTAVVHYDLPWNPNRLEQREGRVDRFGQRAKEVRCVLFFGADNPVDGAVLDVLLRKARDIHRALGVSVPVPVDSQTVMDAVLRALFFRSTDAGQLRLFDDPPVRSLHLEWDRAAAREKESHTRFRQRRIKEEEVERELAATDSVLGDPNAVRSFVVDACGRLGAQAEPGDDDSWTLRGLGALPEQVRAALPDQDPWRVAFDTPAPDGAAWLGRNHPFVSALAQHLLEAALDQGPDAPAARCGVVRTRQVERRTVLLLLRLRFLIEEPDKAPLLAEEISAQAFRGTPPDRFQWLDAAEALDLLQNAKPDANVAPAERREVLSEVLSWWPHLSQPAPTEGPLSRMGEGQGEGDETTPSAVSSILSSRAEALAESHRRIRAAARVARRGFQIRPQTPPDLLGVLVLLPVPKGVAR